MPLSPTLYEPATEHDSCGFGFVCDIAGRASHTIVADALTVLANLEHRGATGSERNTGDGAGILVAIPHAFLGAVAPDAGFTLPDAGYGVAGPNRNPTTTPAVPPLQHSASYRRLPNPDDGGCPLAPVAHAL